MAAELIDGKALAATLRAQVKEKAEVLRKRRGRPAALHVVLVGDDPASQVYVRNKEKAAEQVGFLGQVHRLPAQTPEGMLFGLIDQLNASPDVDGILVQLPLPGHLDATRVVDRIDPRKDVDGLHPVNAGLLLAGRDGLRPCTPSGCMHMLDAIGCKLGGKRALVVGRSILVGKPIALMLLERNATVGIAHSRTADLREEVSRAEVVIAAVGRPELIRGDWIQPGAVVVDVGINRQEDGTLRGDVEFARAAERASWITPVPGGVGPMTIAKLLENTLRAVDLRAP